MNIIKPFSLKRLGALVVVVPVFALAFSLMASVGIDLYYWIPTTPFRVWAQASMLLTGMVGLAWLFTKSLDYLINSREKDPSHD
jgi:hypothetical protein